MMKDILLKPQVGTGNPYLFTPGFEHHPVPVMGQTSEASPVWFGGG